MSASGYKIRGDEDTDAPSEVAVSPASPPPAQWVIRFRDGTYFHSLQSGEGGTKAHAKRFDSNRSAREFILSYQWLERSAPTIERFQEDEDVRQP